jgi:hypothetical protein
MLTFPEADRLYNSAGKVISGGYNLFISFCPKRENLFHSLIGFNRTLKELELTEVDILVRMGKLAAFFHARASRTPVSGASVFKSFESEVTDLDRRIVPVLQNFDQRVSAAYLRLKGSLEEFKNHESNPIADLARKEICQLTLHGKTPTVVVRSLSHLRDQVETMLDIKGGSIPTATPKDLRRSAPRDAIILFGRPKTFIDNGEDFLFNASVAEILNIFVFGHDVGARATGNFGFNHAEAGVLVSVSASKCEVKASGFGNETIKPNLKLDETFSSAQINQSPVGKIDTEVEEELESFSPIWSIDLHEDPAGPGVEARAKIKALAMYLGGDFAVLLDPCGSVKRIDLDETRGDRFCTGFSRVDFDDVAEGDFVLFSTEGSDDEQIREEVNRLLGEQAQELRALQSDWKSRFQDKLTHLGVFGVERNLRDLGAGPAAKPQNIVRWASPASHGPASERDFRAIMQLLDLENVQMAYWNALDEIRSKGTTAGRAHGQKLNEVMNGLDLSEVFTKGFMNIQVEDGGPVKTIYVVDRVDRRHLVDAPPWRIDVPFEITKK